MKILSFLALLSFTTVCCAQEYPNFKDSSLFICSKSVSLRKTYLKNSKIIYSTLPDDSVSILDYNHYPIAKVWCKNFTGYVNVNQFLESLDFSDADKYIKRRQFFIKKYGKEIGLSYFYRVPCIGMNEKMAYEILGQPDKINTTTYARTTRYQWIYQNTIKTEYYYFQNGRLIAIQN